MKKTPLRLLSSSLASGVGDGRQRLSVLSLASTRNKNRTAYSGNRSLRADHPLRNLIDMFWSTIEVKDTFLGLRRDEFVAFYTRMIQATTTDVNLPSAIEHALLAWRHASNSFRVDKKALADELTEFALSVLPPGSSPSSFNDITAILKKIFSSITVQVQSDSNNRKYRWRSPDTIVSIFASKHDDDVTMQIHGLPQKSIELMPPSQWLSLKRSRLEHSLPNRKFGDQDPINPTCFKGDNEHERIFRMRSMSLNRRCPPLQPLPVTSRCSLPQPYSRVPAPQTVHLRKLPKINIAQTAVMRSSREEVPPESRSRRMGGTSRRRHIRKHFNKTPIGPWAHNPAGSGINTSR